MSERLEKRYAIKISPKGEELLLKKLRMYTEQVTTLEEFICVQTMSFFSAKSGDDTIVEFNEEPFMAPTVIRRTLFFCNGFAKQIRLADEEIVEWEQPDTAITVHLDTEARKQLTKRYCEISGYSTRYQFRSAGRLLSVCFDIFAMLDLLRSSTKYTTIFLNKNNEESVMKKIFDALGDHVTIVERSDISDYNIKRKL